MANVYPIPNTVTLKIIVHSIYLLDVIKARSVYVTSLNVLLYLPLNVVLGKYYVLTTPVVLTIITVLLLVDVQ
jgi:hypothetical protein